MSPCTMCDSADGVVLFILDETEWQRALESAADAIEGVNELKAAIEQHAIIAITDARGVITQVNEKFCQISKYSESELVGKTHGILNSGQHGAKFFENLWETIKNGGVWNGEICNRAKDGTLYWVYTTIVPFLGKSGKPRQYFSIRADITRQKQAEKRAEQMAFHDALTGLPNRRLMNDRLEKAVALVQRERNFCALLIIDLDNFKEINDTLGHGRGDDLLRSVSARLLGVVRKTDTVARLGGDEFVVIFEGLGSDVNVAMSSAKELAEKIRLTISAAVEIDGEYLATTPSIGLVMIVNEDDDPQELMKQADLALYKAKGAGRNQVQFFSTQFQAENAARIHLLKDLCQCTQHNQLVLHYQRIVDSEGSTVGVEALVRWSHVERGLVPPSVFIPLAESSNLILPIGQWVLENACIQSQVWSADPVRRNWTMSINVSARQLQEPNFVQTVERIIDRTGVDPRLVRFELTESMFHSNLNETIEKMRLLQKIGIRFSLDDFGTGYSSLSYLMKLPVD